jgi:hypothetical protein
MLLKYCSVLERRGEVRSIVPVQREKEDRPNDANLESSDCKHITSMTHLSTLVSTSSSSYVLLADTLNALDGSLIKPSTDSPEKNEGKLGLMRENV